MASNPTVTASVKRACDSCHQRKVRCISKGTAPCKSCVSTSLVCTYNASPKKKGPKGSRVNVRSKIREAQLAAGFPTDLSFDGRSLSSTFDRARDLLPPGFVESCTEYFFTYVYPLEPILHWQRVQEAAIDMEHSAESYCMVVALCAYVMIQASYEPPASVLLRSELAHMSGVGIGHVLLEESVRVRQGCDHRENRTYMSVLTSWFYSGCYFGLARENTAWTHLRDATTQAQLLGMHDEETYKQDPLDVPQKRALYWLLFIAERTYALQKHRPISLYPTIHPPSPGEGPSERSITVSFGIMVNMFKIIDGTFVNLWNRVPDTCTNAAWITRAQTQLLEAVPARIECTEAQEVQIRITQQWLQLQIWQLSLCQGLVSSVSNDDSLTFKHPIEIAGDLLMISDQFFGQAMEAQGTGLAQKLFDIACCLIELVACTPPSSDASSFDLRTYLPRFLTLMSTFRVGKLQYLPLLLAKLQEIAPNLQLSPPSSLPQTPPFMTLEDIAGVKAIEACRGCITKCSSEQPQCEECCGRHTPCDYSNADSASDRIVRGLQYRDVSLQSANRLQQTPAHLQLHPLYAAKEIFPHIRLGADMQAVLRFVEYGNLRLQLKLVPDTAYQFTFPYLADVLPLFAETDNSYLGSKLYGTLFAETQPAHERSETEEKMREANYRIPYSGARIYDMRISPESLKPSRWTSISSDDVFLTQLLEYYFLYEFPLWPCFHKDHFLDDMAAGKNDYCSSLLVNSVFTTACYGLKRLRQRSEFWNPETYGYHFMAETKRLWDQEQWQAVHSLPTAQAATILGKIHFANGMDSVAWVTWSHALSLADKLGLFTATAPDVSEKERTSRTITA